MFQHQNQIYLLSRFLKYKDLLWCITKVLKKIAGKQIKKQVLQFKKRYKERNLVIVQE